jgi:hypothetical protein
MTAGNRPASAERCRIEEVRRACGWIRHLSSKNGIRNPRCILIAMIIE